MTLTYEEYTTICEALHEHEDLELTEIAEMTGFSLEDVRYVCEAEEL